MLQSYPKKQNKKFQTLIKGMVIAVAVHQGEKLFALKPKKFSHPVPKQHDGAARIRAIFAIAAKGRIKQ